MTEPRDEFADLQANRAKAARQTWAVRTIGATIRAEGEWVGTQEGPTCIPCKGTPQHPANYGRYLALDLDENNRHSRGAYRERTGREPESFGWGVCRHGFGLQSFGDGFMSQEIAEARAKVLNEGRPATEIANAA